MAQDGGNDPNSTSDYYLLDPSQNYNHLIPSPLDNLMELYGLGDIVRSLARTNPDGSKGVKLRKSYKNHIQDLAGKHQIPAPKPVPLTLLDPGIAQAPDLIKEMDQEKLRVALQFDKTPFDGIPGFNTSELAINDQHKFMRSDDMSEHDEYSGKKGKRKRKPTAGTENKRQHQ